MSKMLVWIGQFGQESDFEKYMDQTAFYKWWKEYDEDNKKLCCQFCKELGIMNYDSDFLIMKYSSIGLEGLLNVIPVDTDEIRAALKKNNIKEANAAILYNCNEDISYQKAKNAVSVAYLGAFTFELNPVGTTETTAGLRYMTWIGKIDKSRDEFMEYFNQDLYLKELDAYESGQTKKRPSLEHRCQFCKDIGIKFYFSDFLRIKIDETCTMNSVQLIQSVIMDNNVLDCWVEKSLNRNGLNNASNNCAFCYVPNGFRDKKKNQKVFILKENMKGHLGIPKKYVEEIADYNGLRYLSTFEWE